VPIPAMETLIDERKVLLFINLFLLERGFFVEDIPLTTPKTLPKNKRCFASKLGTFLRLPQRNTQKEEVCPLTLDRRLTLCQ